MRGVRTDATPRNRSGWASAFLARTLVLLVACSDAGDLPTGPSGAGEQERAPDLQVLPSSTSNAARSKLPSTVTDLATGSVTPGSVTLSWTEVDAGGGGPAEYQIRYAFTPLDYGWGSATVVESGSCASPIQGSEKGSTISCTVEGLASEMSYDFQLVAFRVKKDGSRVYSGDLSNVATAATPSGVPGTVSGLSVESITPESVTLSWPEVDDGWGQPAEYHVRYAFTPIGYGWGSATVAASGSCASSLQGNGVGSTLSCTVGGLASGTSYDFQIVAFRTHEDGTRTYSQELSSVVTGETALSGSEGSDAGGSEENEGAGSDPHPFEPAGFTPITENTYSTVDEGGWRASSSMEIVEDGAAPRSPSSVGQAHFPAGWEAGSSPIWSEKSITSAGATRLYVSFWNKLSDHWQGQVVGDKIGYLWTHDQPVFYPLYRGGDFNPLRTEVRIQGVPDGSQNFPPNLASPEILRGRWHHWEILVVSNTGSDSDGEIHWWIDGQKVGEYRDVRFGDASQSKVWNYVAWRPIWGGREGVIQHDQYMWMDDIYVSGAP